MTRLIATFGLLLALAAPAAADTQRLTVQEAEAATELSAELTLGSLLYRSAGSAPVVVTNCRTSGRRGTCRVKVTGTSTCSYQAHVLELTADDIVWASGLRCRS